MIEIREEFRSLEEWETWADRHRQNFETWRADILTDVREHGLAEPITNEHRRPIAISIDERNLRESISVAETNSRKRAGLFALDIARRALPAAHRQRPKILGAEGVTRIARILRGTFPHFLATEFLPTAEEQHRHFPIPHLDLMDANFADETFDLFFSGDVLEHVPDLQRALSEIARMLRAGGAMVSTFPFNPNDPNTQQRASIDKDGKLIHHLRPEYHDNPLRPADGSLVFSLPGWDILEIARSVGLQDARMILVMSSAFGITSSPIPGVFVMYASKEVSTSTQVFSYTGPRLQKFVGLLGQPRSGTTLLCSMLSVHSMINAVYEPFNSNNKRNLPEVIQLSEFFDEFPTDMAGKSVLLVKETAAQLEFLRHMKSLLHSIEPPFHRDIILLLRNPFHAFLSLRSGQEKWWGGASTLSNDSFQLWAEHYLASLRLLFDIAREFNAVMVSYEALVSDQRKIMVTLMRELNLNLEENQLNFEVHVDRKRVRGDVSVATNPAAVSNASTIERETEFAQVKEIISSAVSFDRLARIAGISVGFEDLGVVRFHAPSARTLIEMMAAEIASSDFSD